MDSFLKFFRKYLPCFCAIILLISNPNAVFSQCDECISNKITLFDVTIDVPAPPSTDTVSYSKWLSLFDLGAFARTISKEEDPTKDCFSWVDMGTRLRESPGDWSDYGVENITPAPSGPLKYTDYLLTGSVTTLISNTTYLFTWQLEISGPVSSSTMD